MWDYGFKIDGTVSHSISVRVFFQSEGTPIGGMTIVPVLTDPSGNNITLTLNTHYTITELTNIVGDYEVHLKLTQFTSLGQYTLGLTGSKTGIEDQSQKDYLPVHRPLFKVNDAGGTTTVFIIASLNGPTTSATDDYYNGGYLVPITGTLATCGPKRVADYVGSSLTITTEAFPLSMPNDTLLAYVRL